jgi:hypothetical protein
MTSVFAHTAVSRPNACRRERTVRPLCRQTTRRLWVEVRDADSDRTAAIPVQSEQALDAFHHPYTYASLHGIPVAPESLPVSGDSPQAARSECRER